MKKKFAKFVSIVTLVSMLVCIASYPVLADVHKCELALDLGKSATCTEPGIDVHYKCIKCGKMFEDSNGEKELTDVTLPATDHDWDSMYTKFGKKGHAYYCYNCDEHTIIEEHIYEEFDNCTECGFEKPKPLTKLEEKVLEAHIDIIDEDSARLIVNYAKKFNIPSDVILVTAMSITKQKSEEVKEADYLDLSAKATKIANKEVTIKWNAIDDVDGYIVFGSKCSDKFKELSALDKEVTSYTHSGLKKGTYYKYVVVAYRFVEDVNLYVSVSKTVHVATSGGSVGNAKSVKVNKSKVTLNKGKTFTIKASAVNANKTVKIHRNIGFESSNTKIATVNKKGVIKAKKKGVCYVYAYAQSGVSKKIKVTVK